MRLNIRKSIITGISLATLLPAFSLLQGCDDSEAEKWVDLRYRVEDSYLVEAKNPEPVSFQVKSTDPWEVFGKYDWYTISPSTGEAGETYTVTVTCKENTELDDRIDTLNIKSDYWTGKRFVLTICHSPQIFVFRSANGTNTSSSSSRILSRHFRAISISRPVKTCITYHIVSSLLFQALFPSL